MKKKKNLFSPKSKLIIHNNEINNTYKKCLYIFMIYNL